MVFRKYFPQGFLEGLIKKPILARGRSPTVDLMLYLNRSTISVLPVTRSISVVGTASVHAMYVVFDVFVASVCLLKAVCVFCILQSKDRVSVAATSLPPLKYPNPA